MGDRSPVKNAPVFIQIPTMAGTGSEMNAGGVITDWENTHEKTSVGNPALLAKVVIVDPELTLTVPKRQTAAGGLDILTHLAEFYLTEPEPLPINDGFKETLMKVVVKYLPIVLKKPDDIEARTAAFLGKHLCDVWFGQNRWYPGHYGLPWYGRSNERSF